MRAIARQAEAERERRAKIINAEGEQQAAQKLVDAARILAGVPQAMQLRYLGTLFDIASERTSDGADASVNRDGAARMIGRQISVRPSSQAQNVGVQAQGIACATAEPIRYAAREGEIMMV